jgi:hypothetical protein
MPQFHEQGEIFYKKENAKHSGFKNAALEFQETPNTVIPDSSLVIWSSVAKNSQTEPP